MMVATSEFRKGLKVLLDNDEPFMIVDFQHVKPGKGGAFVRTRLKSLVTGNVLDRTFRSGDKIEIPEMEEKQMQYMYKEGVNYYFMDVNTYDQLFIEEENLGDAKNYLKEGLTINVSFYKGKGHRGGASQFRRSGGGENGTRRQRGHSSKCDEIGRAGIGPRAPGASLPGRGRSDKN